MKKIYMMMALIGLVALGSVKPASAQTIPNVQGLTPFTVTTNYMSLPGFLRWQYFKENKVWISIREAMHLAAK